MVHPLFADLPDQYAAEVFSEMFVPGDYKFAGSADEFDEEDIFPPVPAYITHVMAAYLEPVETGAAIRRQLGIFNQSYAPSPGEFADMYERTIGNAQQRLAPALFAATKSVTELNNPDRVKAWYASTVGGGNRRLLAAYVLARVSNMPIYIDAVVYPTFISEQLPLKIRDGVVSFLSRVVNLERDLGATDIVSEFIGRTGPILRNEQKIMGMLGLAAASSLLPPVDELRGIILPRG